LAATDHLLGGRQAVGKAAERRDELRDLPVLEENLGRRWTEAGRIRDQRELARAAIAKRLNGARGPALEHPEAADQHGGAVFDSLDRARWRFDDLVHPHLLDHSASGCASGRALAKAGRLSRDSLTRTR